MTTRSEDHGAAVPGASPGSIGADIPGGDLAAALGNQVERLANAFFSASFPTSAPGVPGAPGAPGLASPALGLPTAPPGFPTSAPTSGGLELPAGGLPASPEPFSSAAAASAVPFVSGPEAPAYTPPPRVGPSALHVGKGGASPAVVAPPTPGFLQYPPLASAPPPKESDLRAAPTLAAEAFGTPSPVAYAPVTGSAPSGTPYFLDIAGLPGHATGLGGQTPSFVPNVAPGAPSSFGGAQAFDPYAAIPGAFDRSFVPSSPAVPGAPAADPRPRDLPVAPPSHVPTSPAMPLSRDSLPGASSSYGVAQPLDPYTAIPGIPATIDRIFPQVAPPSYPEVQAPDTFPRDLAAPSPGSLATPPATSGAAIPATGREPSTLAYGFRPEARATTDTTPSRIFDPHAVKRDFPILQERVRGRELVWLDNAATTQKPNAVIDRLSVFYQRENSNIHRAAHTLAARATDAYEGAREKVRRFLNAPSTKEIVFARGTTEAINLVAQSWGRRNVREGDEIVITHLEHHANIVPWQLLCQEKGAKLRVAPVDDRGQVRLDEYEKLFGPRTRLASFTMVSNALGTITPAHEMVAIAHRHGALVHVDGAQAVSHMPVDVQSLDCDLFTFSGHKVFGPTGIGALYGKYDVLDAMPPWQGGGNMIEDVTFENTRFNPPPFKFEAGTGNIGDAVGLGAALDYVQSLGLPNIQRYEHELLEYGTEQLARVPGLRMIGTAPDKAGVLSFTLDGQKTEEVGGLLDLEGIAVRSGHHCAQPILRRFGVEATVRASLAPYNTKEDLDALVAALLRLQAGRPHRSVGSTRF